jgi:hypothetical protein
MVKDQEPGDALPEEASALFEAPPDEFTRVRDELAKALKSSGDKAKAEAVRALRKPTLSVWAANQVARQQPKKLEWLMEVDQKMRRPDSPAEFRKASSTRHAMVGSLVDAAEEIATQHGHPASQAFREKLTRTFLAVANDPAAAEDLRRGRLLRDIEPSELDFGISALAQPEATPAVESAQLRRARERADKLAAQAEELEGEAARAFRDAQDALAELEQARARAERLNRRVVEADQRATRKRREATAARAALEEL